MKKREFIKNLGLLMTGVALAPSVLASVRDEYATVVTIGNFGPVDIYQQGDPESINVSLYYV